MPRAKKSSAELPPDGLRCKRSDGRQWRCSAWAMEGKSMCAKHHDQQRKRAMDAQLKQSSTKRQKTKATTRVEDGEDEEDEYNFERDDNRTTVGKSSRRLLKQSSGKISKAKKFLHEKKDKEQQEVEEEEEEEEGGDEQEEGKEEVEEEEDDMRVLSKRGSAKRLKTKGSHGGGKEIDEDDFKIPENRRRSSASKVKVTAGDDSKTPESRKRTLAGRSKGRIASLNRTEAEYNAGKAKHLSPLPSQAKGTSPSVEMGLKKKKKLNNSSMLKNRSKPNLQENGKAETQRVLMLRYMLSLIFPVLKDLHKQQAEEVQLETELNGSGVRDIERSKLDLDERLYCDNCSTSIVDMYRTCPECKYDLCLPCCLELREGQQPGGEQASSADARSQERVKELGDSKYCANENCLLPAWKANDDNGLPCPPKERGGCSFSQLSLRRLAKRNWIAKLVGDIEKALNNEAPTGNISGLCDLCWGGQHSGLSMRVAAHRSGSFDNHIYCPSALDVNRESLEHFQRHWLRGEPVIVREVLDETKGLSWEPMVLWQSSSEALKGKLSDEVNLVKAIDCLDWHEVEMNLDQFLKGYQEGRMHDDGWPEMLQLMDWPPANFLHEGMPHLGVEFVSVLPFHDYTHPTRGMLNLVSKLPQHVLKPDLGPKTYIAYGYDKELGRGDSVMNLHCNLADSVNVLMHASQAKRECENMGHAKKSEHRHTEVPTGGQESVVQPCAASTASCANGQKEWSEIERTASSLPICDASDLLKDELPGLAGKDKSQMPELTVSFESKVVEAAADNMATSESPGEMANIVVQCDGSNNDVEIQIKVEADASTKKGSPVLRALEHTKVLCKEATEGNNVAEKSTNSLPMEVNGPLDNNFGTPKLQTVASEAQHLECIGIIEHGQASCSVVEEPSKLEWIRNGEGSGHGDLQCKGESGGDDQLAVNKGGEPDHDVPTDKLDVLAPDRLERSLADGEFVDLFNAQGATSLNKEGSDSHRMRENDLNNMKESVFHVTDTSEGSVTPKNVTFSDTNTSTGHVMDDGKASSKHEIHVARAELENTEKIEAPFEPKADGCSDVKIKANAKGPYKDEADVDREDLAREPKVNASSENDIDVYDKADEGRGKDPCEHEADVAGVDLANKAKVDLICEHQTGVVGLELENMFKEGLVVEDAAPKESFPCKLIHPLEGCRKEEGSSSVISEGASQGTSKTEGPFANGKNDDVDQDKRSLARLVDGKIESSGGSDIAERSKEEGSLGAALWDIFRRQDRPKLQAYLERHWEEFQHANENLANHAVNPIHDQTIFLNEHHKNKLKEEYGVEPWTFEQNTGEAVFIPAGCPHQVINLKSCMKVVLHFVAPENLKESARLTEEYRFLPKDHHAKEDKLEVKRMALYAADATLRELQHRPTREMNSS